MRVAREGFEDQTPAHLAVRLDFFSCELRAAFALMSLSFRCALFVEESPTLPFTLESEKDSSRESASPNVRVKYFFKGRTIVLPLIDIVRRQRQHVLKCN
jgi:hypothetical protein